MSPSSLLAIGELARRTRCKVETVRYYEQIGLLPEPPRSKGGQRRYQDEHLKQLNFIRRARELGFTIDDVRTLLGLADAPADTCAEVETIARAHLDQIRHKIADLKVLEGALQEMAALCADGTIPTCPIIEAFYQGKT